MVQYPVHILLTYFNMGEVTSGYNRVYGMMMFIIVMQFWAGVEMRRYGDVYYCKAVLGRSSSECCE